MRTHAFFRQIRHALVTVLSIPQVLAFVPALCLAAFWLSGETALIVAALGLPLAFLIALRLTDNALPDDKHISGLVSNDAFRTRLEQLHLAARETGRDAACLVVAVDQFDDLQDLHGSAAADFIAQRFGDRVLSVIRSQDVATRISRNTFLIGMHPSKQLGLEACIQASGRIQSVVEEPVPLNNVGVYLSCSIGFCLQSMVRDRPASDWIEAAQAALSEAQRNGPSTIRAFSSVTRRRSLIHVNLRKELEAALDNGEIQPWFQPQVSTDTGDVTGFEALARWNHPTKGVLRPQVFLPFAEQANLMGMLGQAIRHQAFSAMRDWDRAGAVIPRIGINFSSEELRDPTLIDRLKWELDQCDLTPDRLAVEVLETVFARHPDDIIARNVTQMSAMGCHIDLDDFGTGHAAFASIKRFNVNRIKIDRSFVTNADKDPEQQQLVGAILTMAERLNLETLAEGVETPGEHALMAQLGCHHVQGYGIAKPMPREETVRWITHHRNSLRRAPAIGRKMGGES